MLSLFHSKRAETNSILTTFFIHKRQESTEKGKKNEKEFRHAISQAILKTNGTKNSTRK